MFMMKVICIWN